jgi:hypothetical protein
MGNRPHLLVFISAHGFGHVAQTAPVLNALHARMPELRMTVRSLAPLNHLLSRIRAPFEHLREPGDIGMLMSSALDVRVTETAAAYQDLHREWESSVYSEARRLSELAPDFVLSNVGYLPLAGAQRIGIPCAAMCSLNWKDIYAHYCGGIPGSQAISEQIRLAYAQANAFLRATPGMAMTYLPNRVMIGPVAEVGRNRRDEIDIRLGLGREEKLALISLGGIASRLPIETWPRLPGVRWLVQADWHVAHPDATTIESLEMDFGDILASSDVLICKPGYGSFVEAACSGVPVLYVCRPDWPETPCLTEWLAQHGRAREITRQQAETGALGGTLQAVWEAAHPAPPLPSGAAEAADWLHRQLCP